MTNRSDTDALSALSGALSARVAGAAPFVAAVNPGSRACRGAILWRPGVLVTSEQGLPHADTAEVVLPGGTRAVASVAGRDPGTNVAVLRVPEGAAGAAADGAALPPATEPQLGGLALILASDSAGGVTARLALVHRTGPAWDSMAGGRLDRLIRLDASLPSSEEGGPVLDAAGGLLGMSTLGPRRRVLVIPAATVARVLDPLLEGGRVARGWLGVSLQPVALPEALRGAAGQASGLMVAGLAPGAPAEAAGLLPGDILLALDGQATTHPRAVARSLAARQVGQAVTVRLMRGGQPTELQATVGARPEAEGRR